MNGVSIADSFTLANPETLETVDDLRFALREANTKVFFAAMERSRLLGAIDEFGEVLQALVVAHMNGDDDAVKAQLERIQKNLVHVGDGPRVAH